MTNTTPAHTSNIANINYWRQLSPGGQISDHPWQPDSNTVSPISATDIQQCRQTLASEGYFSLPPLLEENLLNNLAQRISDVLAAGHPPAYALLYDDFFQALAQLHPLLEGILGKGYLMVPDEPDVFFIPTSPEHSGSGPHRDTLRSSDMYDDDGIPNIINIWLPVSDTNELNSCMHVIPASLDPDYATAASMEDFPDRIPAAYLQKVRAVPAQAGGVLGWSTDLLHWGGTSSMLADFPRLSFAMYFQSGHAALHHPTAMTPDDPMPFEYRRYLIEKVWRDPDGLELSHMLSQRDSAIS